MEPLRELRYTWQENRLAAIPMAVLYSVITIGFFLIFWVAPILLLFSLGKGLITGEWDFPLITLESPPLQPGDLDCWTEVGARGGMVQACERVPTTP